MILNSPTISGSLTVTGNIITSGSITISGSIASASYATNAELLDGLDSTAFATTGAYSATSASLYATSASLSVTSGSLSATSGSLSATSGSLSATSGSLSTASGSFDTRVTALEVTGSALSSSLLTVSGSGYATSGSLSTASGSFDSRVATIESKYATTGSNTFTSTQVVSGSILQSGSFTTTGTIIAQTINVQTVTSSVVYSSGSNVFGNSIGNSQTFTGSVLITGSLTIAGASSATSYSGTTIYGSTVACSPIGCFATSCATSFIGGTMSGTTIYGSTAVCSANGLLIGNGGVTATCNYLPKFTSASTIGNSSLQDDGSNVFLSNGYYISTRTDNTSVLRTHLLMQRGSGAGTYADILTSGDTSNGVASIQFGFNSSAKMILTSSGNLGLGVTPSAWYSTGYNIKALQIGSAGALFNLDVTSSNLRLYLSNNAYVESVSAAQTYIVTGAASQFSQENGAFFFYQAASGTANTPITFTTAFTIACTGAATFSSSVTAGGKITVNGGGLLLDLNGGSDTSSRVTGNRGNGDNLHIANIEFYNSFSSRLVGEMRGITGSGGTQSNSGQLAFYTNDNGTYAERMRITSGGNVGIGTCSPSYKLDINLGSSYVRAYNNAAGFNFYALGNFSSGGQGGIYTGAGYVGMFSDGAYELSLGYDKARTMNFTSGGNVGIGTTSPFSNHRATFTNTSVGTDRSTIYLQGIYSGTNPTAGIDFGSTNGTAVAAIRQVMTNTGNGESNIVFHTWNGSSLLERLTITSGGEIQSSGDLKFNSANTVYNASGDFYVRASTHLRLGAGGTNSLMTVFNNGNVSINTSDIGYKLNLNGQPGANGYTAWTNYSDSRLKENVTDFDATNVLDKINRIRPVTYNYNELSGFDEATRERRISGFIAQELMEVFPDMVGTIKKEDTEYYDTNLSNLNLYLVKAIQELKAENDIFKTCLGIS